MNSLVPWTEICGLVPHEDGGYAPRLPDEASAETPQGHAVRVLVFSTPEQALAYHDGYREAGSSDPVRLGTGTLAGVLAITRPGAGVVVEDRGGLSALRAALRWTGLAALATHERDTGPIAVRVPGDGSAPELDVAGRTFRLEGEPDDLRVVAPHDSPTHLVRRHTWYDDRTRNAAVVIEREALTWETDLPGVVTGAAILRAFAEHLDAAETEHRTDLLAQQIRQDPTHLRYAALMRDGWRMFKPTNALHGGAILFPPDGTNAPSRDINSALLARLLRAGLVRYPLEIQRRRTMGLPIEALTYHLEIGDCAAALAAYDAATARKPPARAGKRSKTGTG